MSQDETLSEVLHRLGMRHEPAGNGRQHVYKGDDLLGTWFAFQCWAWLAEQGLWSRDE